ncbi:hypothetical protein BpHYR1_028446 [Brachionus plicatilis]|uniref:Uncharacterized protein n=1 Tax=Brachionus plicatilis TaxID=10195 RepID=A0A3M7QCH4_BRAPC|nr:hypothetical protein BpHYR1_028446 [Brachionus plicatilis]
MAGPSSILSNSTEMYASFMDLNRFLILAQIGQVDLENMTTRLVLINSLTKAQSALVVQLGCGVIATNVITLDEHIGDRGLWGAYEAGPTKGARGLGKYDNIVARDQLLDKFFDRLINRWHGAAQTVLKNSVLTGKRIGLLAEASQRFELSIYTAFSLLLAIQINVMIPEACSSSFLNKNLKDKTEINSTKLLFKIEFKKFYRMSFFKEHPQ